MASVRLRAKTFTHKNERPASNYENESHKPNSLALSPKILRSTDTYDFQIPSIESSPVNQRRQRSNTDLRKLDLSLYKTAITNTCLESESEEKASPVISPRKKHTENSIGTLCCEINYSKDLHNLSITWKSIELHHRPFSHCKIPVNYGSDWESDEYVTVEIFKVDKPVHGRKITLFSTRSNPLSNDFKQQSKSELSIKSKHPQNYTLKFSIYNETMRETDLALGYVFVPMQEVLRQHKNNKTVEKPIVHCDEKNQKKTGELHALLTWNQNVDLLEIKLQSLENLMHEISAKQVFLRTLIYVENNLYNQYSTEMYDATNHIELKDKHFLEMREHQLRKMTIVFKVFKKHFLNEVHLGKVSFGPFMYPTLNDHTMSLWEKLILFPQQTVTFQGSLFE